MTHTQKFLLMAVLGLIPIALMYGLVPSITLPFLFDIDASPTNVSHIFRAVMGLYLALAVYWLMGAFGTPKMARSALQSLIVFMWGLGLGRVISMVVDGIPNGLLVVYLLLEIGFGVVGIVLLQKDDFKTKRVA
ncbi:MULTISPECIES: DUF4345 domain-containing protein [Vibrio]|uniref:DUF4345 domain-containing protein n=1 Tax=Vibrio qingdaonensis TaxID=2829491 RepID=A0A9X3HX19_9VIBR|nr:DUF4345 domain-containing protein [Vibrio qingdaonensis]MCW8347016.1 DUF4345 domain-containing protein [Vibrio qingdaonensis]